MMEAVKQQLLVPENRQIQITVQLPDVIPAGLAEVMLVVVPHTTPTPPKPNLIRFFGILKNELKDIDAVKLQREWRDE